MLKRLAGSVILVILAVSCDPFPKMDKIGVLRDDDGSVEIVYYACRGERVTAFDLRLVRGDEFGGADDVILWRAEGSLTGAGLMSIAVGGREPAGFTVTTRPTAPFSGRDEMTASVESSQGGPAGPVEAFRLADLRVATVLVGGDEHLPLDQFVNRAKQACPSTG